MNAKEYKSRHFRRYKCPSGLIIKVRELSPYTIIKLKKNVPSKENNVKELLDNPDLVESLFKEYIVDPVIPDELSMEDFNAEDFNAIFFSILEQVWVNKKTELEEVVDNDKDFHGQ